MFERSTRLAIAPILLLWLAAGSSQLTAQGSPRQEQPGPLDQASHTHQLLAVGYPERGTVRMDIEATPRLPDARGDVRVQRRDAMSRVDIRMNRMRPASMFGGDYVVYVAWAVSPEGYIQSLGPLQVSGSRAQLRSKTPLTAFGVVVTAEPHFLVRSPSRMIVAQNGRPGRGAEEVRMARIEYYGTEGLYQATRETLIDLPEMRGEVQTDIMEARMALLLAERAGAPDHAAREYEAARVALGKAERAIETDLRDRHMERLSREAIRLAVIARQRAEDQQVRLALDARQRHLEEQARLEREQETDQPALPVDRNETEPAEADRREDQAEEIAPPPPPEADPDTREDREAQPLTDPHEPDREALEREAEQRRLLREAEERVLEAERYARQAEAHARQAEERARQAAASEAEMFQREADQARAEADRARRQLEQAQSEAQQAREEARQARQDVEELQRRLDQEQRARRAAESQVETAHQQAERIQAETERALREAEQARLEAERARREAEEMRQQAMQARDEALRMRQQAEQAQQEAEEMRLQAEQARQQAEQAQQQAELAQAERERARQELRDALSRIVEIRETAEGLILNLPGISFQFGSAELTPEARESLSKVAGVLQITEGYRISIEGHTDSIGSREVNLELSEQRAENVKEFLVERGLPADAIVSLEGFGPDRPVADNETPEGRQQNRRVEIVLHEADRPLAAE
jgi:outer membrane protein OmpA-like peptidoglycan-associated protein